MGSRSFKLDYVSSSSSAKKIGMASFPGLALPSAPKFPTVILDPAFLDSTETSFSEGSVIGDGSSGTVYRATHLATGKEVAIKKIKIKNMKETDKQITNLRREIELLQATRHIPNLTKGYCVFQTRDQSEVWIVMELIKGPDLFEYKKILASLSMSDREKRVKKIIRPLVETIMALHDKGILYRDIKPENIMLEFNPDGTFQRMVLIDFGLSRGGMDSLARTSSFNGTPDYIAPELLEEPPSYGFRADSWQLGILLYELLLGSPPFHVEGEGDETNEAIYANIQTKALSESELEKVSLSARDLIMKLLKKDPKQRPDVSEIATHPFLRPERKKSCIMV